MSTFKEIRALTYRCIRAHLRNPVFIFMGVITPLIYLAFFAPLLTSLVQRGGFASDNVLMLFIPGMLPIIAFSTGLYTGFRTIDEFRSGVIERFRVTPAKRFSILTGPVFFDVCSVFFQSILFIVIALPFGFHSNLVGLLILFVLLALLTTTTSAFGNAVGLIMKSEDRYAPLIQGINLPVLLLSGTLLPMSLAPNWLQIIAHFNPVYYVVEASRELALGHIATLSVLYAFLVLLPFAVVSLAWATRVYKKVVT